MPSKATAVGYSGTPLAKKLGLKEGSRVCTLHAPDNYVAMLAPVPAEVRFEQKPAAHTDMAHVFSADGKQLETDLKRLRQLLRADAMVWVSWPKKSSKVPTNITEDTIRSIALPLGFVDIKVCAVDETWSGLKLVVRKELRAPTLQK